MAWLRSREEVLKVFYPDDCQVAKRQMDGPGALLALEVKGGHEAAARVMAKVKLCTPAVSLGSTDTLIQHPAGRTARAKWRGRRTSRLSKHGGLHFFLD
ncbi:MAG: PLP-dependent transferase [Planctomycetota bacterium]|nr:PLP-dependent transferase [Planctomycetota bacterium]